MSSSPSTVAADPASGSRFRIAAPAPVAAVVAVVAVVALLTAVALLPPTPRSRGSDTTFGTSGSMTAVVLRSPVGVDVALPPEAEAALGD